MGGIALIDTIDTAIGIDSEGEDTITTGEGTSESAEEGEG